MQNGHIRIHITVGMYTNQDLCLSILHIHIIETVAMPYWLYIHDV